MTDTSLAEHSVAQMVAAQVPGFELPDTPRRFALCEYDEDDTLRLYMWGIQTATKALGFFPDGGGMWHSSSATDIENTVGLVKDVELIWLDAPPPADAA